MEVSTADLAEILNVTERRIQQLAGTGVLRRQAHGTWVLPESVQAFIAHRLNGATTKLKAKSGGAEERLKDIKARREELKLAREERELVPLADAIFAMDQIAGTIGLEVNNVPARYTRDLDERDRLQVEIDAVLTKVANRISECGAALRADSEAAPPEDEDDA